MVVWHTVRSHTNYFLETRLKGLDGETRGLVAQTLERFVAERCDPAGRLARLKQGSPDYRLNRPLLSRLGVLGLTVPADDGGMGAGAADLSHALQVLAPGLVLEPVADHLVAASLLASGGIAERGALLGQAVSGDALRILVGPGQRGVHVTRSGSGFRISGTARVVPFAAQADEWLLAARGDDQRLNLLQVKPGQPGVRVAGFRLMDGRPAADLHFDGTQLGADAGLLAPTEAGRALAAAEDLWLLANVADAVGIMDHVLGLTREYLRTRTQFGVAIGTFQALQHRLADMQMVFLEARALLRSWALGLDAGSDDETLARLRRALPRVIPAAGRQIGQEAIQMHGGMGVTEELVISHCNARLQVTGSLLQAWLNVNAQTAATEAA